VRGSGRQADFGVVAQHEAQLPFGLLQLPLWAHPVNWPAFVHPEMATPGTRVVNHGFHTNTKFTIARTHHVRAHDPETHTPDQITPIITRALHHMTATGRTMRAAPDNITDEPPPPDHSDLTL